MSNAYLIWFKSGHFTYAWGETPEDALANYLENWKNGIAKVDPVEDYLDPPPHHLFLASPKGSIWPEGAEPAPGMPL